MRTFLQTRGKSVTLILPDAILEQVGAGVGTMIDLRVEDGTLIITPLGLEPTIEVSTEGVAS